MEQQWTIRLSAPQDAAALLEAGAARLGTSRVVAEVIRNEGKGV